METETVKRFREQIRKVEKELGWSQRNDIQCCGVTMAQCHALLAVGEREEAQRHVRETSLQGLIPAV